MVPGNRFPKNCATLFWDRWLWLKRLVISEYSELNFKSDYFQKRGSSFLSVNVETLDNKPFGPVFVFWISRILACTTFRIYNVFFVWYLNHLRFYKLGC
jgi:hypothetical protein